MKIRTLLGGAAIGAVLIASSAWAADAPPTHSPAAHKKHPHKAPAPAAASKDEVSALAGEVEALKQSLASETAAREALQSQVQTAAARADAAEAECKTTRAQLAAANDAAIKTIPVQVADEVKKEQRSADGLYVKGVKITPGGFLEAAEVYRQHDTANDISTALNTIPFPQTRQGHAQEYLFTPRQSRVSALVEGKPTSDITLSMYGEFDFGNAQSANSNESNSYNPRIRHFYGTIDWADSGWHLLTGQTFSLVTLDSKGITPRNEVTPLTIDGQYHVGFTWTRQPVVRLTKDMMDKHLWISVSAENPQTTFTGTVPAGVINNINNGQGFFAGATNALAPSTQSLNHVPDFIAKVAVEEDLGGHHLHAELLGLARDFYVQDATFADKDTWTGAIGGGLAFQVVPGLFDIQATGLSGRGVGRYASGQLPDVTFSPDGRVQPIRENIWLLGAILHANKSLDLWAYAGQERDERAAFGAIGYGNPLFVNSGCDIEGSALTCTGNTRALTELSAGFWQKFYSGPWGHAQVGLRYSHIERDAFSGVGGAPEAHENMVYTSFRYYPFQ